MVGRVPGMGENPRSQATTSTLNGSYHTGRSSSVKLANRHNPAKKEALMRHRAQKRESFQILNDPEVSLESSHGLFVL